MPVTEVREKPKTLAVTATVSEGPSGGLDGQSFIDPCVDGEFITQINMRSGDAIDSLGFSTNLGVHTPHGGFNGNPGTFNIPKGQFLTRINGQYGAIVQTITFTTNTGLQDTFGREPGSHDYNYEAPDGFEICGFVGASGSDLNAIGVILRRRG